MDQSCPKFSLGRVSGALRTTRTLVLNLGSSVPSTRIRPVRDTRCAENTNVTGLSTRFEARSPVRRSQAHARQLRNSTHQQRTQNDDLGCAHHSPWSYLRGRSPRIQPVGSWSPLRSSSGAGPAVRGQWARVLLRLLAFPPLRLDQHVHCVRPSIPEI